MAYAATPCNSVSTRLFNLKEYIHWVKRDCFGGSCGRRTAWPVYGLVTALGYTAGRLVKLEDCLRISVDLNIFVIMPVNLSCLLFYLNNGIENQVCTAFRYQTVYFISIVNLHLWTYLWAHWLTSVRIGQSCY